MSFIENKNFDRSYKQLLTEILSHGQPVSNSKNQVYTQLFGNSIRHDLRNGLPIITLRKLPLKNVLRETLWDISGSSSIEALESAKHFWEAWSNGQGQLPHSYGNSWRHWPKSQLRSEDTWNTQSKVCQTKGTFDQLLHIEKALRVDPLSRHLVLQTYNPSLDAVCPPCHTSVIFSSDGVYLDALVNGRSQCATVGLVLDSVRYALVLSLMANTTGLSPRFIQITNTNTHIYSVAMPQVTEILERESYDHPVGLKIKNQRSSIADYKFDDLAFTKYVSHPSIKMSIG